MALTDNNNGLVMPVAPVSYGNNCNNGFGGWGGDGWWVILFLFALMGNGFGGWSGGGTDALYPYMLNSSTQNDVSRGFDNAALAGQLSGIQSSISNGFSNAEVSGCNRAMNSMQTAYTNQIASMNQNFANQQALDSRLFSMEMTQQNCCCENRAGIADLKYTIATEACADRSAISEALRDVLEANTASTQRILDQMCADKIDAKNEKIAELQNQLNMAAMQADRTAATATILANNQAQTTALEQYLAPIPRPAYIVQNPNCCAQNYGGCGCGGYGIAA